jgi:hypothetical protein
MTFGQPLAGSMLNSGHALCSGFWCSGTETQYRIYLPLVLRGLEGLVLRGLEGLVLRNTNR